MNSDNSQQDNWVQKRVRNLESSGRLRHRSEQVNGKPKPEYSASKRNSLPVCGTTHILHRDNYTQLFLVVILLVYSTQYTVNVLVYFFVRYTHI